jgi:hypothetical protein
MNCAIQKDGESLQKIISKTEVAFTLFYFRNQRNAINQ